MKATNTVQQKINVVSHFLRQYRCLEQFPSFRYRFSGDLEMFRNRSLSGGGSWSADECTASEVTELFERDHSTAELLALAVLSGDPLADRALADYLQEIGIDPSAVTDRVLDEMSADRSWTHQDSSPLYPEVEESCRYTEIYRSFDQVREEIERRKWYTATATATATATTSRELTE